MEMKKIAGYILASMLGSTLAIGAMMMVEDRNTEALLEIERLKAQHREENNHFVSYGLPSETVDFVDAAQRTVNAVVHVKTTYQLDGGYYTFDPIRHFFFGDGMNQAPPRMGAGAGSGVIISKD